MTALRLLAPALALASLCSALAAAAPSGLRLWQFTSGQTLTARYLWSDRESLFLKDPKGKELRMPVGLLANADLELVREIQKELKDQGIVFEAPLTWERYHSKNVKSLDAERAGVYPLDSQENSMGKLELEFGRFGTAPGPGPGRTAVLRLTTANRSDSGTDSAVRVLSLGKIVGSTAQIKPASTFDIPLSPRLFEGTGSVTITVTCGNDTVHIRSGKSGAGPRLLIIETKSE